MKKIEMWIWVIAVGILASLIAGCETSSSAPNPVPTTQVHISPEVVSLDPGSSATVHFSASAGSGTYSWSQSDSSLGALTASNATATYVSHAVVGTNTVTVTDSNGSSASARVEQG